VIKLIKKKVANNKLTKLKKKQKKTTHKKLKKRSQHRQQHGKTFKKQSGKASIAHE